MNKELRLQLRLYPHREQDAKIMELFEGSVNPNATLKQLLYELATNTLTQRVTVVSTEVETPKLQEETPEEFEAIDADDIDIF
ncbi:MAG: hypothetical protein SOY04_04900 [Clostridium celatum]|nr:hypothetical protein [Clostridium celatum]